MDLTDEQKNTLIDKFNSYSEQQILERLSFLREVHDKSLLKLEWDNVDTMAKTIQYIRELFEIKYRKTLVWNEEIKNYLVENENIKKIK